MAACLRCDSCGSVMAEHDGDLRTWWRLTRHGLEWANEPGEPPYLVGTRMLESTTFVTFDEDEMVEAIPDLLTQPVRSDEEVGHQVLHFCTSACLAAWASTAEALG